jgi:uncharacterized membrane protein YobD (UPF0266 family)
MASIHNKYDAEYIIKNIPLYDGHPPASDDFFKKTRRFNEDNQIIGKTILITIVVIIILLIFLMWISDGSKNFSFSIIFLGGLIASIYYIYNFNIGKKYRGLFNNSRRIKKYYHSIRNIDFSEDTILAKELEPRKNIGRILYLDD